MMQPSGGGFPHLSAPAPEPVPRASAPDPRTDVLRRLDRLQRIANRMDRAYRITFTRIRFGWDGLAGLVPVLGDTLATLPAFYILFQAHRMGASKPVLARMLANIGIDWAIGLTPVVGDMLDVAYKSNLRNVALLRRHLTE